MIESIVSEVQRKDLFRIVLMRETYFLEWSFKYSYMCITNAKNLVSEIPSQVQLYSIPYLFT